MSCLFAPLRISIRAFTQLFDEETTNSGLASPLFTDTFLSLPIITETGQAKFHWLLKIQNFLSSDFFFKWNRRSLSWRWCQNTEILHGFILFFSCRTSERCHWRHQCRTFPHPHDSCHHCSPHLQAQGSQIVSISRPTPVEGTPDTYMTSNSTTNTTWQVHDTRWQNAQHLTGTTHSTPQYYYTQHLCNRCMAHV